VKSTCSKSSSSSLRILSLVNLDWNRHLGAARVYMELHERWQAAGHLVEHFSFSEAFPEKHRSSREYAVRRLTFPRKAAAFVRANGGRFDVIDALAGSLSASKRKLRFQGLMVARSVGYPRVYDRFERTIPTRWPARDAGTLAGKIFYSTVNKMVMRVSDAAARSADLINVPNKEEESFLKDALGENKPIIVQPYGLTSEHRSTLFSAAASPVDRLRRKTISFVGMWLPRKGARIWGEIARRVLDRVPEAQFRFLGTMVAPEIVLRDLGEEFSASVHSVPEFSPAELTTLLSTCTIGGFPSYVEGFGLAILEQLAAGIPTVAFDQGGPRDILGSSMPQLLVPTGDVEGFANALVRTLQFELPEYQRLVELSLATAESYSWSKIADDTLEQYRAALREIKDAP
jgi:glycosyltransferase involved in cell wall biosynthesis